MVGPSGSGKSSAWQVLLEALEAFEGVKGESYVLDPKVCAFSDTTVIILNIFLGYYKRPTFWLVRCDYTRMD